MSDIARNVYSSIANLDPLRFDEFAMILPELNQRGEVQVIRNQYDQMLERADAQPVMSQQEATACLRDLDFVAGSLIRHGAHETAEQSVAQATLSRLGAIAGTVPRGTVFTYAAANPGDRRRMFTGADGEELFIQAVKEGIQALDVAMTGIHETVRDCTDGVAEANSQMNAMISSIITVKRGITPEFFTHQMRPYFDNLIVGDTSYAGAGGAQMQLVGIDRMAWGADNSNVEYQKYYSDNVRYLTPQQRSLISSFEAQTEGRSIITLLEERYLSQSTAVDVLNLLRTIKRFRYPHRKVASDNFAIRQEGSLGSGNYTSVILNMLIDQTEQAIVKMEDICA